MNDKKVSYLAQAYLLVCAVRSCMQGAGVTIAASLALLTLPTFTWGYELSPWYPPEFQLQARADYLFQTYHQVATSHRSFRRSASDQFLNLSLGIPYYDWYAEGGLLLADTKHRSFGLDSYYLLGRYQLLDDVTLEDPVSLVASLILTKATKPAVHDISSFHHGRCEVAFFFTAGKEISCRELWVWHGWGSAGIGVADTGSPWLAGSLHLDQNYCDRHIFRIFLEGLYGLGGDSIRPHREFHGYGPISHRSLDLGACYSFNTDSDIMLSLSYSYRVFSRNFPKNASRCMITVLYPFSL